MEVGADRAIIKGLNLSRPEITFLCVCFEGEGIPSNAPFFLSLTNQAEHEDSRGIHWRVNTKTLAQKLSNTDLQQRHALNRAIFRFWEHYPAAPPADAMYAAGLI
ncbi:MAG TPA: hypothetical protein VJ728_10460 [Candidatus Binataceae bacterium]|nr:hypothetical protein [Candidatus Binataceae bacterium]